MLPDGLNTKETERPHRMSRLDAITSLTHPRFSRTRTSFRRSTLVLE
jgi:transcriptional antiterminator Rof (Rho-off)